MSQSPIRSVAIVGGGTAGWMAAVALSHLLPKNAARIRLIESEEIGIVGVGEATVPHIRNFNATVGIDERDFMRETLATIKLGIEFRNWNKIGDGYFHPFGYFGRPIGGLAFHQCWRRLREGGDQTDIGAYSVGVTAARKRKFAPPVSDPESALSSYSYAFQFDANLYAPYLRRLAEGRGVLRTEGKVVSVELGGEDGNIQSVTLADGQRVEADFFIDCTGFASLLLGKALKTGYEDWSRWLICDRAVAVPSVLEGDPFPFTRVIARGHGWQWQIPLQHRMGNGHVYSSQFLGAEQAANVLLDNVPGKQLAEPRQFRFTAGRRAQSWAKNCIGVGLAGGFLEPLESTSIYLIQIAVTHFVELFPTHARDSINRAEFNRRMEIEYERIRDFLILHYKATSRADSEFWRYCQAMEVPDSLAYKMEQFTKRGYVVPYREGMFYPPSWIAVCLGQGLIPERYDPQIDRLDGKKLTETASALRGLIDRAVDSLPSHADFLASLAEPAA